ncbi:NYN domain-containing protein [Kushneria sp. AK178]
MVRVALFADVQNIYYTARETFACQVNYAALWRHAVGEDSVAAAYAYAIERHDPRQQQFQHALRDIGFEVKLKPFIQRRDGSAKGDWDVGITLDVFETAQRVDRVVLISGDGDFAELLTRVQQRFGVSTAVYGVQALTAQSLKQAADRFVPIEGALLQNTRR